MNQSSLTIVLGMTLLSLPVTLHAGDGSTGDFHPRRFWRRSAAQPVANDVNRERIRQALERRGMDPTTIDARIDAVAAARASGTLPAKPATRRERSQRRREVRREWDADSARTRMEQRGLDAAAIDARIARVVNAQQKVANRQAGHSDAGNPGNRSFDADRFRSRMEARGMDSAQIEARMNRIQTRLGSR